MYNEVRIDPASLTLPVSEEARMRALDAFERELTPRRALSELRCVDELAERIALHVESLVPRGRARCLEASRGGTAPVQAIKAAIARTEWQRLDVGGAPAGANAWAMPYGNGELDVALLWNVLHDTPEEAARLLAEAARVAPHVIVTDRFADPSYSRTVPWLANLVRHDAARGALTREAFAQLVTGQRLVVTALDCALASGDPLPGPRGLLGAGRSFIAVLRRP